MCIIVSDHSATLLALAAGAFCCGAIPQSVWQRLGRAQLDGLGPRAAVPGQGSIPAYASLRYRCGAFGSPMDGAQHPGEIRRCSFLRTPMNDGIQVAHRCVAHVSSSLGTCPLTGDRMHWCQVVLNRDLTHCAGRYWCYQRCA